MENKSYTFTYDSREITVRDLLPLILKPIQDFQGLTDGYGVELHDLYTGVHQIFDDNFINTASDKTLAKWEKWLDVLPNTTDTLDERRFRIIAMLTDMPPYTDRYLENKVRELCGDAFRIVRDYKNYKLSIELSLNSKTNTDTVLRVVKDLIPANIELYVGEFAARYYELSQYTHEQLASFTHTQIRSNAMIE